jgi:hypothetical protein
MDEKDEDKRSFVSIGESGNLLRPLTQIEFQGIQLSSNHSSLYQRWEICDSRHKEEKSDPGKG